MARFPSKILFMIKDFKLPARFACLLGCLLLPCYGSLVTYSNQATFNAVNPNLVMETFASGFVDPAHVTTCNGPLSNTQGNNCFPDGSLLPGVSYSATSGQMAVIGQEFPGLGNTTKLLSPNLSGDVFDLAFTQANAVGFTLFPGPGSPGNVVISIYSSAQALLGTFTVPSPLNGTFFGVLSSTDLIGHVDLLSQAANFPNATITNLSFGITPTTAVPEPCSWLLVSAGFAGLVWWCRPRHHFQSSNRTTISKLSTEQLSTLSKKIKTLLVT